MASLLDLADARLRGLLDSRKVERPSMVGLLGNREPQGTLAGALQGYAPPQMTAMTNPQVMDYARNVAQSAQQNLQTQMSDLDRALIMDQGGINIGDRQALARLMEQIPGLMGATAYHGTPHTIRGKFDISKVGTGEGNQSFGYGMYFAENPAVAKQYQAALSNTKYKVGERELKGNEAWAAQFLHDFQGDALPKRIDADTAIQKANEVLKDTETKKEIIENIKKLDKSGVNVENGNLYKVDIPDEYIPNMLDWDKPINKQSELVQNTAKELLPKIKQVSPWLDINKMTGQDLYRAYQRYRGNYPDFASEGLSEFGIKGIRYLDQGSRNPGFSSLTPTQLQARIDSLQESIKSGGGNQAKMKEQLKGLQNEMDSYKNMTSNFVVFDPSTVKILERNNRKIEGLLD
jgi:hypothetical protein